MKYFFKHHFPDFDRAPTQPAVKKPTYLERLARYGVAGAHPGGLSLTRRLLSTENLGADTVLLDVGCGAGQTSAYIGLHYPCKIVAVDLNPEMVAIAQRKFAQYQLNIHLQQADARHLPFSRATFDLVLSESVTVFTEIAPTLREYYRVLKPGGCLLAIEVTATEPLSATESTVVQQTLGINLLPTTELWRQMFTNAGFSELQVLAQAKIHQSALRSPLINRNFQDYHHIMLRYHAKIHYAVYRCQK